MIQQYTNPTKMQQSAYFNLTNSARHEEWQRHQEWSFTALTTPEHSLKLNYFTLVQSNRRCWAKATASPEHSPWLNIFSRVPQAPHRLGPPGSVLTYSPLPGALERSAAPPYPQSCSPDTGSRGQGTAHGHSPGSQQCGTSTASTALPPPSRSWGASLHPQSTASRPGYQLELCTELVQKDQDHQVPL